VQADPDGKVLTAKGSRQAEAVLEAAIRCLGEDGYAGTSLQRVADAAGVQKRMVLYYHGSRERLIAAALRRLGDTFLGELEQRLAGLHDPAAVIDSAAELFLEQAADRALLTAYFGLLAESATDPVLAEAFEGLRERALAIAHRRLDELEAHGHELSTERELLILAAISTAHGIGLELMQHGRTPQLERALGLARVAAPVLLFD
jgi:AcrR family transcriptional regulator